MPKQTRLGDTAEIYQPRKRQSEKEKLSEMPMKKKLAYLWYYYKIHALVIILTVAIISYFIYTVVTPKTDIRLNAVFLQNAIDDKVLEDYRLQLSDYLKVDKSKKQDIEFNTNFYDVGQALAPLNAFVAARELDVMIVPESEFENFAKNGFFDKLSEQLPTDLYSLMTNRFYITSQTDDTEKNAYGIYLTDTDLYKNNSVSTEPYVLGIVANSKHKDNAVEFIRYLFQQFP